MPDDLSEILESEEATLLATGFVSTEGPLWHPGGFVTFVDTRGSKLVRWDAGGQVTVIRENTGEGNGCILDYQGRLIMCEGANRRITRTEADGTLTVIANQWQGHRFHRPNDVVCRSDGNIYFTDPSLRVPPEEREIEFAGVFRLDPEERLHVATEGCEYPNGLAFSPDESVLYVSISRMSEECFQEEEQGDYCSHRRIRAFDVAPDGSLSNNRIFCDMSSAEPGVPDGMKVDTLGRLFCSGSGGIWVIDPEGNRLGVIRPPEGSRNLAFGGADRRTLFITGGQSLYSMRVKAPGIVGY